MPCEHFQDAIIEVAASGGEPQGAFRVHLSGCADCREALAAERSLFRSIDTGVHTVVKTEVPGSFVLRVSRRIEEEAGPARVWRPFWVATAALVACSILLVLQIPRFLESRGGKPSFAKGPELSSPTVEAQKQLSPRPGEGLLSKPIVRLKKKATQNVLSGVETPEVLVPPQGEEALARYVALLGKRTIKTQTGSPNQEIAVEPLEIAEIDLGQLLIPSVQPEETRSSN